MAQIERQPDNIRAALRWGLSDATRAERVLHLGAAMARVWTMRGHWSEGRRWMEAACAHSPAPSAAQARALLQAGHLAKEQGDHHDAARLYQESLAWYRQEPDKLNIRVVLNNLANLALERGEYTSARVWYDEALALRRRLRHIIGQASTLNNPGELAMAVGDYELHLAPPPARSPAPARSGRPPAAP